GFFTAMLWRRRGLGSLLEQRMKRVVLPLAIGLFTIVPLMNWVSETASADQFDNLVVAVFFQNETAVERLLDEGVDPDGARGEQGETALHLAALVDRPDLAELLLEAGADPFATDNKDDLPFGYAFFAGSEDVADVLVANGFPDGRPPGTEWEDLEGWGFGAGFIEDELGLDSWITSFHHLWFLWFLVWLVAGFTIVALLIDRQESRSGKRPGGAWPRRLMWALVPLTLLPQLAMGNGGKSPAFGPDTSAGLIPIPRVLIYYAVFFAFGALMYGRRGRDNRPVAETLGRNWWAILIPAVVILFPVALGMTFGEDATWLGASIAQVAYTWAMIFGLMGLFRRLLSTERRGIRYLSDSAYWLYLAHLPLIIAAQAWIREWDLPSGVKFAGLTVVVSLLLLVSYQLFVRYTPIGTMLNGKRTRPNRAVATAEARG
ncbi:MAG: acyltransferase family protein, partial [bacterium]|nr:acyltransferase family protein [bacterium]